MIHEWCAVNNGVHKAVMAFDVAPIFLRVMAILA
jgi:hypothetical protein